MAASTAAGRLGGLVAGRRLQPQAVVLAAILQLLPRVAASSSASSSSSPAVLPYTPTTVLVPSTNASVVYIFTPDASGQIEFLAVNISSTVLASSIDNITTLTQGVPFLANNGHENTETTFVPSLRSDGAISVFAGSCSSNASASLWTYTPSSASLYNVEWTNSTLSLSSSQTGPWFLGGSIAFSNEIAPTVSNSTFYMYGGMCPTSTTTSTGTSTSSSSASSATATSDSSWQSQASYTNKMLKLVPGTDDYTATTVSSKGPPVAEAGFSFTALSASVSNRSGIVTQEVATVVLGGHTQTAFVNMSTAAVWSLPEEAWSFVTIANPSSSSSSSSTGTELAVVRKSDSSTSAPDSRSGHTAILSEDGNSIVVLGGWVGDVGQAADPQLAILEMGADYGNWQWAIPDDQPAGTGIYGHGAALLPGNVMLVYGGYNISSSSTTSSAKLIRRSSAADSGLMFFNLTSQTWLQEYTNPNSITDASSTETAPSSSSSYTSSSKIGYGVGLGLGIPLLILVLALAFRSCRRHRRRTQRRERLATTQDFQKQLFLNNHDEMIDVGDSSLFNGPSNGPFGSYTGGHDAYTLGRQSLGFETLRGTDAGAAFPSYESPKMGADDAGTFTTLRKPSRNVARGLYQPTTINDYDALMSGGAGPGPTSGGNATKGIHPIYEDEEEEEEDEQDRAVTGHGFQRLPTSSNAADAGSGGHPASPDTAESLVDPFLTPTTEAMADGSHPLRSTYAGAFAPATHSLNPFVKRTPSPEAASPPRPLPVAAGAGKTGPATTASQDRDVQEWVSGLEIEDLLFAPPAPGVVATVATPVPAAAGAGAGAARGRRMSLVSKSSHGGSPTRNSFLSLGTAGRAAKDDEARTGSNLSDRSALTFLSRTTSLHSRLGTASGGGPSGAADNKGTQSVSSTASFNTAATGFSGLRAEGPSLLYGKPTAQNEGSAGGSSGTVSASSLAGSVTGSVRTAASSPVHYSLRAPPPLQSQGPGPNPGQNPNSNPFEYGGAAAASAGRIRGHQRSSTVDDSDENTALTGGMPGTPSKSKPRRTWMGNFMRIFSSSGAVPGDVQGGMAGDDDLDGEALGHNSIGTGAQQGPNYQNMAHATLLRRKQGRSDWEADEWREEESTAVGAIRSGGRTASLSSVPGFGRGASLTQAHARAHGHGRSVSQGTAATTGGGGAATGLGLGVVSGGGITPSGVAASGRVAEGRREGSGKSDDWDVEKAVQSRVVQVMFTMPRDQLRVVNAEVERDEDDADIASDHTVMPVGGGAADEDAVVKDADDSLSVPKLRRADKNNDKSSDQSKEQQRPTTPPPEQFDMDSPDLLTNMMKRQEDHMRLMQEALAESKRLLSGQHLEPWADDHDPRPRSMGEFSDEAEIPKALSRAAKPGSSGTSDTSGTLSKNSAESLSSTPPRAYGTQHRREIPEEEYTLATAAALARTLMAARKPAREPKPKPREPRRPVVDAAAIGGRRKAKAGPSESALSPSARAIPTRPTSPAKTATAAAAELPVKTTTTATTAAPTPPGRALVSSSAKTRSRPSLKTPKSADSLATTASRQSATSSKSGYVASMIDRIETASPAKMQ